MRLSRMRGEVKVTVKEFPDVTANGSHRDSFLKSLLLNRSLSNSCPMQVNSMSFHWKALFVNVLLLLQVATLQEFIY